MATQTKTTTYTALLWLRDSLYYGSWETMHEDLEARLLDRPYIYRLHKRIEADIKIIGHLIKGRAL